MEMKATKSKEKANLLARLKVLIFLTTEVMFQISFDSAIRRYVVIGIGVLRSELYISTLELKNSLWYSEIDKH